MIVQLRIRCSYLQHGAPPRDAWSLHAAAGDDNGLHLLLHMQLLHMAVHVLLPLARGGRNCRGDSGPICVGTGGGISGTLVMKHMGQYLVISLHAAHCIIEVQ